MRGVKFLQIPPSIIELIKYTHMNQIECPGLATHFVYVEMYFVFGKNRLES